MACRGLWECLLKLLNFLLTLTGLAMVGYGVYLLVEWNRVSSSDDDDEPISPTGDNPEFLTFGRPMLVAVSLSSSFLDKLPKAWCVNPLLSYFLARVFIMLKLLCFRFFPFCLGWRIELQLCLFIKGKYIIMENDHNTIMNCLKSLSKV